MVRTARDPVAWVVVLFAATFLLQRFSLPNISVPLTVPFVLVWMGLALHQQIVAVDMRRLILWLAASAVSALVIVPQLLWVTAPFISISSWGYWIVVWLPLTVHLRDRSREQFSRCLRALTVVGLGLSSLSILFAGAQLLGWRYRDLLGEVVPGPWLVQGYNTSYPTSYESELWKSNGFLALEPSFLSFMLGVCIVCAILVRAHPVKLVVLLCGLVATAAGSGMAVIAVAVLALLATGRWRLLKAYLLPSVLLSVAAAATPFGQSILSRTGEASNDRSSTALRAIEPYRYLWPQWINDPAAVLFGRGAGSSRWVLDNLGIMGLQTPNLPKLLFDYGLLAGSLLVALMLSTYLRAPEPALAVALAVSLFTVQAASQPLVMCSVVVAALWAPRPLAAPRAIPVSYRTTRRPRRSVRRPVVEPAAVPAGVRSGTP